MNSPATKLQIITFLDLLADGLVAPQISSHAESLGCSHIVIGFVGSLFFGCQLIASPIIGSLSDINGRSQLLLLTLCASAAAYIVQGVTDSVALFLTLRAVLGITKQTLLLTRALTPDYITDKQQLSQVFARLNTLRHAGRSLGPVLGGHIVQTFPSRGFAMICFIAGAVNAFNSGLLRTLPKEKRKQEKNEDKKPIASTLIKTITSNVIQSREQFEKIDWQKFSHIFSFQLFIALCIRLYITSYVLFLKNKHNSNPITIGFTHSLLSATGSFTSFSIIYINKFYEKDIDFSARCFHVSFLLVLSLFGVTFAPNIFLYLLFVILLGISSTLGNLITEEVVVCESVYNERGAVLGVANSIKSLSGAIIPLVSGVLGQCLGVTWTLYVAICVSIIGTYRSYVHSKEKVKYS